MNKNTEPLCNTKKVLLIKGDWKTDSEEQSFVK